MVTPLRAGEAQPGVTWPLPPGLHVLHMYTRLKMSSSKVSMVVRNMSESVIILKKGVQVVRMVSASPVSPAEISPEMEVILGAEDRCQPLSVAEQQQKLLRSWIWMALAIGLLGMPWRHETLCYPSMMFLHCMGMNLVALVWLSIRFESQTVSHLRSGSGVFLHCCWRRCMPCSGI